MFEKIKKWLKHKIAIYRINTLADEVGVMLSEWQYNYILNDAPIPQHYAKERGVGKTTTVMLKLYYKTAYEPNSVSPKAVWDILNSDPDFYPNYKALDIYRNYYYNLLDKVKNKKVFNNRLKSHFWYKVKEFAAKKGA